MEFKPASLLLFVVLLGTGILTFIVIERQKELDKQQATILQNIGEPIVIPVHTNENQKTPAQNIDGHSLNGNQYLSTLEDLNGDGIAENINIRIDGDSFNGTKTILTINGIPLTFPGGNPQGYFGIVDINTSDTEKEVAVSDEGPSSDYTTVSMTLAKGEHTTILGCDNTTWCKLADLQGNIGWLNATTFNLQAFEGLSFAD